MKGWWGDTGVICVHSVRFEPVITAFTGLCRVGQVATAGSPPMEYGSTGEWFSVSFSGLSEPPIHI